MKLIKRTAITDSNLTSSNVPETDYTAWSSVTSYTIGQKVIVVATHKIYEALTNNTNKYPPDYLGGTTPDWLDIGATNKWAMFDESYQSQTINSTSIIIVCAPGRINSLGLLNVDATTINITLSISGDTVYSNNLDVNISSTNNWYEYFYNPIERKSDFIVTDIPVASDGVLTVTMSANTGVDVKCGLFIPGFFTQIGDSLWGASIGITDYSKKEVDTFGNYSVLQRSYSSTLSDSIWMPNGRTGYIKKLLADYRTTPALWLASEQFEGTLIYGFYRDFNIVLEDYSGAQCSIEIEGLT